MVDFPTLMAELGRLGIETQRFAAIGAALRLKQSGEPVPAGVATSLHDVVTALLPGAFDRLTPDDIEVALNYIIFQTEESRAAAQSRTSASVVHR